MKLSYFFMLCILFIYSCGKEEVNSDITDNVTIDTSKLDKVFAKKDESKKTNGTKPNEETIKYPTIKEAPRFPRLEVNASYSSNYDLSMEQMMVKLWDVGNTCKNCKYNMPSLVQAKEFIVSETEKIVLSMRLRRNYGYLALNHPLFFL